MVVFAADELVALGGGVGFLVMHAGHTGPARQQLAGKDYLASLFLSSLSSLIRTGSDPLTQVYTTSMGRGGHSLGAGQGEQKAPSIVINSRQLSQLLTHSTSYDL